MKTSGASASTAGAAVDSAVSSQSAERGLTFFPKVKDGTLFATVGEIAVGEYTGTGAALDVACPFDPVFVAVFNLTDGTMLGFALNTTNGGGNSFRQSAALGIVKATTGITFGTAGQKKFSLGIDAIVNVNTKVYQFLAIGV